MPRTVPGSPVLNASAPPVAHIRAAAKALDDLDYARAFEILAPIYSADPDSAPADGLSHYGRCLVVKEKRVSEGLELCRRAMRKQFFDATHYVNLARAYLFLKDRNAAVQVVNEGLSRLPNDPALRSLQHELKIRRGPVIAFLSRDHVANIWLGRFRDSETGLTIARRAIIVTLLALSFSASIFLLSRM